MGPFELDARAAWSAGAGAFVTFVESGTDYYRHLVHGPALLEACGDVRGAGALDVGCGRRYFETGPAVCDWSMPRLAYPWRTSYHRLTLSEWAGLTRAAGFVIRGLHEPRPSPDLAAARPELDGGFRMPLFLIFELVKGAG